MGTENLVNTLRVQRAKRNLTQEQLADLVGVSRKTINTVERCIFVPSTLLALKLSHVLDCTVEEIFSIEKTAC